MKKNSFYITGILSLLVLVFSSCNKDPEKNLLGDYRLVNPYAGTDTIKLKSNLNKTLEFVGLGRSLLTSETKSTYDESTYFINEVDETIFICTITDFELLIKMFTANADAKFLNFVLSDSLSNCQSSSDNIQLSIFNNPSASGYFNDSVLIGNKYYYDVFKFPLNPYNCSETENYYDTIFYNTESGVIKLTNLSGEEFVIY